MCTVAVEPQILKTKLYPPRLHEMVSREWLLGELGKARSAKLIAIVAGAGYGKSTLAAEFLRGLGSPFVWYQLEDTDSDLAVFLSYLIAGLRDIHPEFGEKTLEHMASAGNVTEQSRAILSTFITELDQLIAEELFIALDDFDCVRDSTQISEAVNFLVDHMLPNLHFLILSRSRLALDLSRLRAKRELLELSEADLSFTTEETSSLFSEVFGMQLSDREITALRQSTEGWITGLVLFYLTLKGKAGTELDKTIRESGASLSVVSDYLSNAVYENQSEEVKDFAIRTSILSRLNPQYCDELLGVNDSRAILSSLVNERLFTIPLDDYDEWYRYHFSLQAFLQHNLKEHLSPVEIKELHLKAAALWEENGELEEALHHYMEAEDFEKAAEVLEDIIAELVRVSRIAFLERELSRLPGDILEEHPRLSIQKAQIAAMFGDYDVAVATAKKASEAFSRTGDVGGEAQSLLFSAAYRFSRAEPEEAEQLISRVRKIESLSAEVNCEAMALECTIRAGAGDDDEAKKLREEALGQAGAIEDPRMRARVLNWCGLASFLQGRFNQALEAFLDADSILDAVGPSATRAFVYALSSRTFAFLGRLPEAREMAEKGMALGESLGFAPMACLCRAAGAVASAYSGDSETALNDASIAAPECLARKSIGEVWYSQWFLSEAFALLGENDPALQHLRSFEQMAGKLPWVQPLSKVAVTACSIQNLGLERTIDETQKILQSLEGNSAGIVVSLARSILFRLKSQGGEQGEAREELETYLKQFDKDIILLNYTADVEYLLPAFTDIFSEGEHLDMMDRVYSIGGAKSAPYLKKLEKSDKAPVASKARGLLETVSRQAVEPLKIRMLGSFQVSRGGNVLSSKDWKSKKALTVFKYLALNRKGGFIPRDVLMELLWPDVTVDSAAKSLNAALTSLRKTLEPEAGRGQSSYLVSKGDSLLLELGPGGWVDSELFREKLAGASKAREVGDFDLFFRTLTEARELYSGEFCSEDLYEDWCQPEREALKGGCVKALTSIATEHLRRGEDEEALSILDEAISKDPDREELYRRQMIICSHLGNRAGIEAAFKRCKTYLEDNFEVPPSPETTELYKSLRKE